MRSMLVIRRTVSLAVVLFAVAGVTRAGATDVRELGAVGDGITDDTPAIRQALAGGGEVLVPGPGTYVVAPAGGGPILPITVSGTTLRCTGGAVLKLKDASLVGGQPGRLVANANAAGAVVRVENVTIADCTFDGNDTRNPEPQVPFQPDVITCVSCVGFTVRDTRFLDVTFAGVVTYYGSGIHITGNRFFGLGQTVPADSIQVNGGQHVVIAGNILENTGEGILFEHATGSVTAKAEDATITGNVVATHGANEVCVAAGQPFSCCSSFQAGNGTGLCAAGRVRGSAIGVLGEGVTVAGNTVRNANVISIQSGRGYPTSDVNVTGNLIVQSAGSGILVQPVDGTQPIARVSITGNHVDGTAAGASGIEIVSRGPVPTTDITVGDNVFLDHCASGGTGCAGLYLHAVGTAGFADVHVLHNRIAAGGGVGVRLEGPTTNVGLDGNRVEGNGAGPYAVTSPVLVNDLPLTDAPKTCNRDRTGQRYRDLSLDEECVCNGGRWCRGDGGGCGSSGSCG